MGKKLRELEGQTEMRYWWLEMLMEEEKKKQTLNQEIKS